MGMVATSKEASPEGTRCSDQHNPPFPPKRSNAPTVAAAAQLRREGGGAPRARVHTYKMAPAMTNRQPAMKKGGIVSMA